MILHGQTVKLGDDISTDHIIPGRWFHLRSNLPELAQHTLEDLAPDFRERVKPGDFLVAGKNFGLGSSREHAPLVIKLSGIRAILVQSAARIFFRNAINQGVPVLICDTTQIGDGDTLEIDLKAGAVKDLTNGRTLSFGKIPDVMLQILDEGGLVPYIRKQGDFRI